MGIMICETHGRVGFVETCSHVAKEIERKNVPDGHRLMIMGNLFVCDDCFRSLGFEKFASLAELSLEEVVEVTDGRMEAFEVAYEAIEGRRVFCLKCLAELESQSPATALPIAEPDDQKR
ncbi:MULTISPECIES: hypothetical protein [Methylosinus]|uniref:Uncharacterized protein n=1 Tax=Methylosinus trichosporium (strain ATCC 35070 / NCIMB 11131 / UNIQEM 75 / OB3b) TaxID=595536 RepID=A0A2D2CZW5_METT3|nr:MULTISPECIES: hypothetical protein [Methylosinus]ATQ68275.1 hypothetical protein CQW49_10600 [Methylosinus trichosporium OB3b]OBS50985.1 hypothetical protein A8B73_19060 [Methylosinus sp. 3S-1]